MFLYIIILLLIIYIFMTFFKKQQIIEGNTTYTDYSDNDCSILANQNQTNLKSLQEQVDSITALKDQLTQIQNTCDTNTQQIQTLTNQIYNTNINSTN